MTNVAVDLFTIYQVVKRLVVPFDHWDAYKLGVIDNQGQVLIPKAHRTPEQLNSFRLIDVFARNLKRLIALVPGGSSKVGTLAAALMLMKEDKLSSEQYIPEHQDVDCLLSEEVVNAGGGAIAGIGVGPSGEPGVTVKQQRHYKIGNRLAVFPVDSDRYHQAMWGKHPRKTYKSIVSDDEIGSAIREYGRSNQNDDIALQNGENGAIQWLIRRKQPR